MADLTGVYAKLNRAREHSDAFDRCFDEWIESDPYRFTFKLEPETGWWRFYWQVLKPPPVDLPLIFGDLLTNLRGTLDYLAWQLVLLSGQQPTDRTAFPIVKEGKNWGSACGDRLAGINAQWVSMVESLQPYHRLDAPELHPLAVLDHVNNINKHRALPITVMRLQSWKPSIGGDIGGRTVQFEIRPLQPVEDGAEFYAVRFEPTLTEPGSTA
jgi:hypothetical protein